MDSSLGRIRKDFRQLAEVDRLEKRVEVLEAENRRQREEVRGLKKSLTGIEKKLETLRPGGQKVRATPLIAIVEEMMKGRKQTFRVVDIRDKLLQDERVKSKADNFYAVIATAMNNSSRFEKVGPGLYRYTGG